MSVIDLEQALAGDKTPEIIRVPTQIGPWGITTSPNGRWVVAANRESQQVAFEGNTISIIDVDLARAAAPNAEVARVLVGTSDPNVQTRPFIPSFTPDGKFIIVPNFRANNVSIVDLDMALAGNSGAEVARIPLTRPPEADGCAPSSSKGLGGHLGRPLCRHLRRAANHFRAERDGMDHRPADANRCRHGDGRRQRPLWSCCGGTEVIIEL